MICNRCGEPMRLVAREWGSTGWREGHVCRCRNYCLDQPPYKPVWWPACTLVSHDNVLRAIWQELLRLDYSTP